MRVMMKYKNLTNTFPEPCESFDYGQVEDYCVELKGPATPSTIRPRAPMELSIYPQPAQDFVRLAFPEHICGEWNWTVLDVNGKAVQSGKQALSHFQDIIISSSGWQQGMYVVTATQGAYLFRGKVFKIK